MAKPSIEKVIEHHLSQNVDQKLTPQLIAGLVIMLSGNLRQLGLVVVADDNKSIIQEAPQ